MGEKYYILKYFDIDVAIFMVKGSSILRLSIINNQYLPYGYSIDKDLINWLYKRGIPVTRDGIKRSLSNMSTFEFMILNQGLSLTDHYWVKEINSLDTWNSVNCFKNNFKFSYDLEIKDGMIDITDESDFKPSASLKGDLKKKWIIDKNGNRILIKGNYGHSCLQSIAEVFATLLHTKQNKFPFVSYDFIRIPTKNADVVGCASYNFVDYGHDFVSAADVLNLNCPRVKSMHEMYNLFIKRCVIEGLDYEYVTQFMEYMIMCDFLMTNTDRHLNNFGVLRNINNLSLDSLAPIYDSGNSLGYTLGSNIPVGRSVLKIREQVGNYNQYEVSLLKHIKNKGLVDIRLLPTTNELWNLLSVDTEMTQEKKERIVRLYEYKVLFFERFQNGEKIWTLR